MSIIYSYPTVTPASDDLFVLSDASSTPKYSTRQATLSSIKDAIDVVDSLVAGSGISVSSATGAVTIGNTGVLSLTSSNTAIELGASTGALTITSTAYAGGSQIGHVPTGGAVTTFLAGNGTWRVPAVIAFSGTTVGGALSYKNSTEIDTSSTVIIGENEVKVSPHTGMQFFGNVLKVGDISTGNSQSVALYADGSECLKIDDQGAWTVNSSTGTNGQFLKSTGSGSSPIWDNIPEGPVTGYTNGTNQRVVVSSGATTINAYASMIYTGSALKLSGSAGTTPTTASPLNISYADGGAAADAACVNLDWSGAQGSRGIILDLDQYNTGIEFRRTSTLNQIQVNFKDVSGTPIGSITHPTTTSTAYNTTSDYRLKENVVEMTGAVDRVKQLKPSRFNFIASPQHTVDGFLAHEAAAVVPECVTGDKDGVDFNGDPSYQGIDQSKLVPLLVGAIKELTARIEALEA